MLYIILDMKKYHSPAGAGNYYVPVNAAGEATTYDTIDHARDSLADSFEEGHDYRIFGLWQEEEVKERPAGGEVVPKRAYRALLCQLEAAEARNKVLEKL